MQKNKIESKLNKIDKKKVVRLLALILILTAGLWAYYFYGNVATVNGKLISRLDYIKNMEKQVGKQVLDQMITESLIEQEANKKGIKISQNEINDEVKKIEEQIKAQGQTLEAALTAEGMDRKDLENRIRLQKMVDILSNPKKEITEAEIKDFLEKNKDQIPKGISKEELNEMVKTQLENQAKSEAATNWLNDLKKQAKIFYR